MTRDEIPAAYRYLWPRISDNGRALIQEWLLERYVLEDIRQLWEVGKLYVPRRWTADREELR